MESKVAVGARTRSALLLASALGCSLAVFATPAAALPVSNDACGSMVVDTTAGTGSVTCTATSGSGNTYPNGIVYVPTQPVDLTVVLQGGTTGAVKVDSSSNGVQVRGYAGHSATVTTYAGASITAANVGIGVTTTGAGAALINNAASVTGAYGLSAMNLSNGTGGASVVNSGALNVGTGASYFATGIEAVSAGGTVSVTNSGAITVNTDAQSAAGIYAWSQTTQTINNNAGGTISVTGSGDSAVGIATAPETGAATTITNAAAVTVSATGATGQAYGIQSDGDQTLTIDLTGAGSVSATGYSAFGVHASAYGSVSVTGAAGTTIAANSSGGPGAGILARSTNDIVTVNVDGVSTTGANTPGVNVDGYNGVTVDVGNIAGGKATGVVTTGDNSVGVLAYSYGGPVAVTNHGLVQTSGASSGGVSAYGYNGSVTVTNAAGATVHTKGDHAVGVYAASRYSDVVVNNAGSITTEGNSAPGVVARANGGGGNGLARPAGVQASIVQPTATIVNTSTITTSGDYSNGATATARGDASITAGTIVTKGKNSIGAYADSTLGTATITSTSVTTWGANSGGLAASAKYGATVTTGAVTTHGASSDAVNVFAPSASNSYTTIHITGPIVTEGEGSRGVIASGASVTVDGSGTVSTTGANAPGIQVIGMYATVNVTGAVSATGTGSTGVGALGMEASTVTVGKVTANSVGVFSESKYGTATTNINGAVVSTKAFGASVSSKLGAAAVTVSHSGSISGATGGVIAVGYTGASVANHGVITSTSGFAVEAASNGASTIVNASDGVITGPVNLSGATGSAFTNAGVWNASGASTFSASYNGGGAGGGLQLNNALAIVPNNIVTCGVSLCNTGTVNVAAGTSTPTTVTITGATAFNNAGLIDMRNGHAGDVFDVGGAAFVGATGSQLAVDVDATATGVTADKLIVGAASGTTSILVKDLGGFNLTGAAVAQAANGSPSGAFVLGTTRNGFVDYALGFDASATTWNLYGLPSHAAFETLKLPQLSQAFAERSDDVWYQRMQEVRDASAAGSRKDGWEFWGQVYGGEQTLSQARTFNFSGVSFNEDLSTKSAWGGVQFGVDHVSSWRSGRLLYGFTAGYLEQWSQFNTGSTATYSLGQLTETGRPKDTVQVKGANFGAYWGYTQGGWFLNGLAKVDFGGVDVKLNSIQLAASTNATVWGVNGEFGYRFGDANLFVEPVLRLQGGDTNVDKFGGDNATVTYPDETNLLATAGARVGGKAAVGSVTLSPWFGAYVADELLGANRSSISLGGTTLNLEDQATRSFARFDLGVTANAPFGAQGFVKAGADTGSGVSGWTVNFGARWRF